MWDDPFSNKYTRFSRRFMPQCDFQLQTLAALVPDPGTPFHILELCCGEGLLTGALLQRFPGCTVHALDGSPAMLKIAAARLAGYGERFQPALFELGSPAWRQPSFPADAVLSPLAIHHLAHPQKEALFQDVYRMLAWGGVFLIADVILPESAAGMAYAAAALDEEVRRRTLELDGSPDIFEAFTRERRNLFRYPEDSPDKPASLLAQLHWLKQAGFRQVDVFWMLAGHAIFGGSKPLLEC
ncbi:MAG: class I SAM-dependent methyltransferase [Anaerolineaceae bacterium]|nr:class I SAM-dependent methyltransferase [Anaerolineaceae bacterium]